MPIEGHRGSRTKNRRGASLLSVHKTQEKFQGDESMTGNEDRDKFKNDKKVEKKLFQTGGPGGPGRGNFQRPQEISDAIGEIKKLLLDGVSLTSAKVLDLLGRILLHGTTSADMKTRTDSVKLFFNWLTKRIEVDQREKKVRSLITPGIAEIMRYQRDKQQDSDEDFELIED